LLAAAQAGRRNRSLPLIAAAGRVLAVAQQSTVAVPPLDNSAMDGYAVRTPMSLPPVRTAGQQRIPAGTVGAAPAAGYRRPHLHRRASAGRGRRRRDAGTLRTWPAGW
jgi:molybdopterin molybdotransferase